MENIVKNEHNEEKHVSDDKKKRKERKKNNMELLYFHFVFSSIHLRCYFLWAENPPSLYVISQHGDYVRINKQAIDRDRQRAMGKKHLKNI